MGVSGEASRFEPLFPPGGTGEMEKGLDPPAGDPSGELPPQMGEVTQGPEFKSQDSAPFSTLLSPVFNSFFFAILECLFLLS